MARKLCPACKTLKGASATTCDCGHVFDAATVVLPTAPKICPHCGASNSQKAHTCHCGRHFDLDVRQTRAVIVTRRNRGLVLSLLGGLALVGQIALAVVGSFLSVWLMLGATVVLSGGVALLIGGSRDLAAHDADHPRLPKATVKQLDKRP